ncbi:hypothetical protein BC941DRAFT_76680 [Chlamydoabsidia padenii]|nr:hypothetical protein BC941DRAFT_76680 [Chlamydoabsidia padenii]
MSTPPTIIPFLSLSFIQPCTRLPSTLLTFVHLPFRPIDLYFPTSRKSLISVV